MTAASQGEQPRHRAGWTGFVLLVVPVDGVQLDAGALVRSVTDRIGTDVVLADTVRVAGAGAIDAAGPTQAFEVANALVRAALGEGRRLFAPQAVFGCVLVGRDAGQATLLADALARTRHLNRLPVYFYAVAATGPDATAEEVTGKVLDMVASHERWPDFVLDGLAFRAMLRPPTPAAPAAAAGPTVPARPPTSAAPPVGAARPTAAPPPDPSPAGGPYPDPSPAAGPPPGPPPVAAAPSGPVPPPVAAAGPTAPADPSPGGRHPGRESHAPESHPPVRPAARPYPRSAVPDRPVAEPSRRALWRDLLRLPRRSPQPTQADALRRLARSTYAVDLVYLVLVTDSERVSRATHQRREELILHLDRTYARLANGDSGREPRPVEVSLYVAGRSLTRLGPLQPAGRLADTRPPRVELDYVDLVECVGAVRDAYRREVTALHRREIDVPARSVVFVSTTAPLADSETVDRFRALCAECRVAWILLGADPDLMSGEFAAAGALVLEDHPDLVHELAERGFLG